MIHCQWKRTNECQTKRKAWCTLYGWWQWYFSKQKRQMKFVSLMKNSLYISVLRFNVFQLVTLICCEGWCKPPERLMWCFMESIDPERGQWSSQQSRLWQSVRHDRSVRFSLCLRVWRPLLAATGDQWGWHTCGHCQHVLCKMSGVRFTVTKADEADPIGESSTDAPNYEGTDDGGVPQVRIVDSDGKDG